MATDGQVRLVLWDIDHTLIESRGVGRAIYERVFPEVTGQPLRELASVQGRTELDLMRDTLQQHDIDPTEDLLAQLATALAEEYHAARDELTEHGRVLPGVWHALDTLAHDATTHQGILTGNTAAVARIKVEAFGLDRYLDLTSSAYGDDHPDRPELVTLARTRAAHQLGTTIPTDHVTLIGDTPNDVHAALTTGAHIIATATGKYTVDDLLAAGATTPLNNLTELAPPGHPTGPATDPHEEPLPGTAQ